MRNITIGKKFALTCMVLLLVTAALAVVSNYSINSMNKNLLQITTDAVPGVRDASALKAELLEYRGNAWKHIASSNPQQMEQLERENAQIKQQFLQSLNAYEAAISQAEDRAEFEKFKPAFERFEQAWLEVLPISRAGKNDEAYANYQKKVNPRYLELRSLLEKRVNWNLQYLINSQDQAFKAARNGRLSNLLLTILAFSVGIPLTFLIVRSVNRVLGQTAAELSESAEQLVNAASQVSSSSQSLAQSSSEQAASLEETSASSEEIHSMVRQNTENSRTAATLVASSQQKYKQANQSLEESVMAMDEINQQSGKISRIIKVIDEIAFQTNILALNAAVEAARAGEAGAGFAVVADEVRTLAQRCAQAANDTTTLIAESISKSETGKVRVDQVAVAIRAIIEDASQIKMLVDEVNVGSQEQSRGIEQVARAIMQMEQTTQSTAASAQESAAAANELTAQSAALQIIVARLSALVGGDTVRQGL